MHHKLAVVGLEAIFLVFVHLKRYFEGPKHTRIRVSQYLLKSLPLNGQKLQIRCSSESCHDQTPTML